MKKNEGKKKKPLQTLIFDWKRKHYNSTRTALKQRGVEWIMEAHGLVVSAVAHGRFSTWDWGNSTFTDRTH